MLVHGFWENDKIWGEWPAILESAGYSISFVSIADAKSYESALLLVKAEVDWIGPCILMGHSFGGLLARKIAGMTPNVEKLVAVCPAPANLFRLPIRTSWRALKPWYLWKLLFGVRFSPSPADIQAMLGIVPPPEMRAANYGSLTRAALSFHSMERPVTNHVLIVTCCGDPTCGPRVQAPLVKRYGFSERILECRHHFPMLDEYRRDAHLSQIMTWLANCD